MVFMTRDTSVVLIEAVVFLANVVVIAETKFNCVEGSVVLAKEVTNDATGVTGCCEITQKELMRLASVNKIPRYTVTTT